MNITAIPTDIFHAGESLVEFIVKHVPSSLVEEGMVIAITSKIVSLAENRLVPKDSIDKKVLVEQESDHFLGEIGYGVTLSIKDSLLLPGAGIDESNSENGDYILHPEDSMKSAAQLRLVLMEKWELKNLGLILTDSRSGPLRLGVTGAALACAGFLPVIDKIGELDLFGRPLKVTKINIADSLAASCVLMMGEAAEGCPLAVLTNAPVQFVNEFDLKIWQVDPQEDMYLPLYQHRLSEKSK